LGKCFGIIYAGLFVIKDLQKLRRAEVLFSDLLEKHYCQVNKGFYIQDGPIYKTRFRLISI